MKRLELAVFVVLSLAVGVNAQTFRGAINGTVVDPSGAVIPNAAVKATETATGIDHNTVTTNDGAFAFQDIPLGFYKVTVTASSFPVYSVDKVEVTAGTIYTLQVKLSLQRQATTVEVSAAALTLDTTTSTQSANLTSDVVQDVPLNGRDFTQLITVKPGFAGYNIGGFGSVNGARGNQVNWQIDGVDNNDFWHNIPAVNQGGVSGIAGIILPIDSIEEFSAQTQSGSEAGRNVGGTVNVVTKSGGNDLHGSAYYFWRNEYLAAASPFLPTGTKAPPLRDENYGFSLGGPVRKNKIFYFTSYERQQYIFGLSGVATEPSAAWVANADALLVAHNIPVSPASCKLLGPLTSSLSSPCTNTGLWPTSGAGSVAGLPATQNNFFSPVASTGFSNNGVARVDYNISDKHRLYLRWFGGQGSQTAPLGASPALGTASSNLKYYFEVGPIHVYNYSLVLNSAFSSRLTNQVLVGTNYFNQSFSDANATFDTKALGLFLSPDATIHGKPILGAPKVSISGFEKVGLTQPAGRNDITWHVTDIVSYTVGAHQLRFGGEIRQAHLNEFYHTGGTGSFSFTGGAGPWNCAGRACALADFLAGDVSGSSINVGSPERFVVANAFNLYFQDDWQLTHRLNLSFGARYEYFGPLHSNRKDIANFIPGKGLLIQGNGLDSLFEPDKNNFAPRLGFAYQANQKGDLVVRGAVGVFYDQINVNPFLDFRSVLTPAPPGIQGNPIGPAAVSSFGVPFCGTLASGTYNWDAVQQSVCPAGTTNAGKANATGSVFGPVLKCGDPLCVLDSNGNPVPDGLSLFSVNHNFRTPYFYNYSLQVEKSLGSKAVFQVGYVGSEGRKLNVVSNINQGNAISSHFRTILQLNSVGTSNYNSLQSTFRIRAWHGLTSQFAYTWAHALDEDSQYRGFVLDDAFNKHLDYGNSDFDTRHSFAASFTYAVPKANWATGWSSRIVNDWQLSSVWKFNTGQPYDELRSGLDLIGDPFKGVSHSFNKSIPGVQWINPAAFAQPAAGTIGNVARNRFYGPGLADVDLSVFKNIPITERVKVQLRAEMFNLTNRINLANGLGAVATSGCCTAAGGFGQVTDTAGDFQGAPGVGPGEPFNMQLALKIIF